MEFSERTHKYYTAAVCKALHREWYCLINSKYAIPNLSQLRPPTFALIKGTHYLGRWRGYPDYILEINEDLVLNHPWYVVLDVLRHEIAHQITEAIYPALDEPPHGKAFREICKIIGASPEACSDVTELDTRLFSENFNDSSDNLLSKVRKLLNLADGGDVHEAEVALAKAMELMAKHGITEDELAGKEDFATVQIGKSAKTRDHITGELARLLSDFWAVETIWDYAPRIDPNNPPLVHELQYDRCMLICGTKQKVKIASYVFDYIINQIDLATEKQLHTLKLYTQRRKRDFAIGILSGLREKLERQASQNHIYALIHAEDAETYQYFHRRYPAIVTRRGNSICTDKNVIDAGKTVGKKLSINPGLESSGNKAPKRLNQ